MRMQRARKPAMGPKAATYSTHGNDLVSGEKQKIMTERELGVMKSKIHILVIYIL